MFSTTSTSHVLTRQSRAIVAVADTERHRFLAGTCCLREENEIHLIDFDEESNSLAACTVYRHPNEIWSISPNPRDASSFFTSHNTGEPFFLRSFARSRAPSRTRRGGQEFTAPAVPCPAQDRNTWHRSGKRPGRAKPTPAPTTRRSRARRIARPRQRRARNLCGSSRSCQSTTRASDRAKRPPKRARARRGADARALPAQDSLEPPGAHEEPRGCRRHRQLGAHDVDHGRWCRQRACPRPRVGGGEGGERTPQTSRGRA